MASELILLVIVAMVVILGSLALIQVSGINIIGLFHLSSNSPVLNNQSSQNHNISTYTNNSKTAPQTKPPSNQTANVTTNISSFTITMFIERGLPKGTNWSVMYDNNSNFSNTGSVLFNTSYGKFPFIIQNLSEILGSCIITYSTNFSHGKLISGTTDYVNFTSNESCTVIPPIGGGGGGGGGNNQPQIPMLNLYINQQSQNLTLSYGNVINITANSTQNAFVGVDLNGQLITPIQKSSVKFSSRLGVGEYKIVTFSNSSGVSNVTYWLTITKALPNIEINAIDNNFTYNGTVENISGSIQSINNQLSAKFSINSNAVGNTTSHISYSNAAANTYIATISTLGNENYTNATLTKVFKISKAIPRITLVSNPAFNFTQNGTYLEFEFSLSSVYNQLNGNFYLNNSLKSHLVVNSTYNVSSLPSIFIGIFNTSGNQNYTAKSIKLIRQIYAPAQYLYLNGVEDSNNTIVYNRKSNFTAVIAPKTDYISIYVNGTRFVNLTKGEGSYLGTLAAGFYRVTVSTNSTGISNVTYYEKILPATPSLSITSTSGNFTYNGSNMIITTNVSSLNNQLSAMLSVNSRAIGSTKTSLVYSNATANKYVATLSTSGNNNYTSANLTKVFEIKKATPAISLTSSPSANFTYNGTNLEFKFSISSVQSQLTGNFYLNGYIENASVKSGIYHSSSLPHVFLGVFNTSGNQNYTSTSVKLVRQIYAPIGSLYLNGVKNNDTSINYSSESNFTAVESPGSNYYISLYVNDTKVIPLTHGNITYVRILAAGLYRVTLTTNLSGVSNMTYYENINPISPLLSLSSTTDNFTYNGSKMLINSSISSLHNQLSAKFSINSNAVGNTTSHISYSNAAANTYIATISTLGNENYTNMTITKMFKINKAKPYLNLTASLSNFTYNGTAERFKGSIHVLPGNNLTSVLYINGNPTDNLYSNASAGKYVAVYNTSGNQNYTNYSMSLIKEIAKAHPYLKLTALSSNFTYNGNPENFTYGITTVNNQLKAVLNRDGINTDTISSPENFYANASAGLYNMNISTTGNQNYTPASISLDRIISKAFLSQSLTLSPSSSYSYDRKPPIISDNLIPINGSIVQGQKLMFSLYNASREVDNLTVVIGQPFNFSNLNDNLSFVGSYNYIVGSTGNQNYSVQQSQNEPVTINYVEPQEDEQLFNIFVDNFSSLGYNVTAIAQKTGDGVGPAYLLNGLTDADYWYQVGVSYDWPTNGGPNNGFTMNYEVFSSSGASIYPTNSGGGVIQFNGPVHSGDSITLSLSFVGSNVYMVAFDRNTSASASTSYPAEGTYFLGNNNSHGYFTGLMTEWYHVLNYTGAEHSVTYTPYGTFSSAAYLCADEWNPSTDVILLNFTCPSYGNSISYPTNSYGIIESYNNEIFITGGSSSTQFYSPIAEITKSSSSTINIVGIRPPAMGYFKS